MTTDDLVGIILFAAVVAVLSFSQWMKARGHDEGTLSRRDVRAPGLGRTKYLNDDEAWQLGNATARPLWTWVAWVGVAGLVLMVATLFFWQSAAWWVIVGTFALQVVLMAYNTYRMVRASGGMQD